MRLALADAPQKASDTCVRCHDRTKHALWAGSQHDQRNVGCVSCHSVHSSKGPKQLAAASEPELCATCHRNITNKQHRFNHMPVRGALPRDDEASTHRVRRFVLNNSQNANKIFGKSCASCHQQIHGSNAPSGKAFLR